MCSSDLTVLQQYDSVGINRQGENLKTEGGAARSGAVLEAVGRRFPCSLAGYSKNVKQQPNNHHPKDGAGDDDDFSWAVILF